MSDEILEEEKPKKRQKKTTNGNPLQMALILLKISEKIPLLYSFIVFLFTFFLVVFVISYSPQFLPWVILFCAISYVPIIFLSLWTK